VARGSAKAGGDFETIPGQEGGEMVGFTINLCEVDWIFGRTWTRMV